MEIVIVLLIALIIIKKFGYLNVKNIIDENQNLLDILKENDYEFYLKTKYGQNVDVNTAFMKRLQSALFVIVVVLAFSIGSMTYIHFMVALVVAHIVFKSGYNKLRNYYKRHLYDIDVALPYYLKGLEILIQHYTVPVALANSIEGAPGMFKDGLQELVDKINKGDSTVEPYMEFARNYPVKDSMRMMRLLYRLSLGGNKNKHEQLSMLSKNISALQAKSREMKYAARLKKMEGMTTIMLVFTGGGAMIFMLMAIFTSMF